MRLFSADGRQKTRRLASRAVELIGRQGLEKLA